MAISPNSPLNWCSSNFCWIYNPLKVTVLPIPSPSLEIRLNTLPNLFLHPLAPFGLQPAIEFINSRVRFLIGPFQRISNPCDSLDAPNGCEISFHHSLKTLRFRGNSLCNIPLSNSCDTNQTRQVSEPTLISFTSLRKYFH